MPYIGTLYQEIDSVASALFRSLFALSSPAFPGRIRPYREHCRGAVGQAATSRVMPATSRNSKAGDQRHSTRHDNDGIARKYGGCAVRSHRMAPAMRRDGSAGSFVANAYPATMACDCDLLWPRPSVMLSTEQRCRASRNGRPSRSEASSHRPAVHRDELGPGLAGIAIAGIALG